MSRLKEPGDNPRKGEWRNVRWVKPAKKRSQLKNPVTGKWTKRDNASGKFMDTKADARPFKGVRKERNDQLDPSVHITGNIVPLQKRIAELERALSRIAREAGIGACSSRHDRAHIALQDILALAEKAGFNILGEKV